ARASFQGRRLMSALARPFAIAALLAGTVCSACSSTGAHAPAVEALPLAAPAAATGNGAFRIVRELPAPSIAGGGEQPISGSDVLEVDVFQVDDLDRTVQVDASGRISLPLIGAVAAAGKTVRELELE